MAYAMCGESGSIQQPDSQWGEAFRATEFKSPSLMIPDQIPFVEISLTQNELVLTMEERSGSVWVLDNVDR
jgi:hypothetical protein